MARTHERKSDSARPVPPAATAALHSAMSSSCHTRATVLAAVVVVVLLVSLNMSVKKSDLAWDSACASWVARTWTRGQ